MAASPVTTAAAAAAAASLAATRPTARRKPLSFTFTHEIVVGLSDHYDNLKALFETLGDNPNIILFGCHATDNSTIDGHRHKLWLFRNRGKVMRHYRHAPTPYSRPRKTTQLCTSHTDKEILIPIKHSHLRPKPSPQRIDFVKILRTGTTADC
ncbi:hypothetical protein [Amycolatopsis sp. NPDC051128]|uniref:hypothetical protein n=1 Tax=Amycolatopsis sp. NPDC051128 TaxID=3155412 RepID=UPI00343CFD72